MDQITEVLQAAGSFFVPVAALLVAIIGFGLGRWLIMKIARPQVSDLYGDNDVD